MKRSRAWIRPAILAALLFAFSGWLYLDHIDPRYEGRRASEWLIVLENGSDAESKQAKLALAALGERAIPEISRLFFTRDNQWRDRISEWLERLLQRKSHFEDAASSRAAALQAIEVLGEQAAPMLPRLIDSLGDQELKQDAISALGSIWETASAEVYKALDHKIPQVRAEAVRLMVASETRRIVPKLKEMVNDKDPEVRAVSIEALTVLSDHDDSVMKLLRPMLKDPNEGVRACAVNSLGYLAQTSPELIPEFAAYSKDSAVIVRYTVVWWLWHFAPRDSLALDALVLALADTQFEIRVLAAR